MLIFLIILLGVGLVFLAISKKLDTDVEKLDANFTGDLLPDAEETAMYYFEKKKKIRNSKGAKYFAYLLFFWTIVWSITLIVGLLFD